MIDRPRLALTILFGCSAMGIAGADENADKIEEAKPARMVDPNATVETRELFSILRRFAKDKMLFGHQDSGSRLDAKARDKGETAARGTSRNRNLARIDIEQTGSVPAQPFEGILEVLDDPRQLGLRCEPIVDRDNRISSPQEHLLDSLVDGLPSAVDQRAAMVIRQRIVVRAPGFMTGSN